MRREYKRGISTNAKKCDQALGLGQKIKNYIAAEIIYKAKRRWHF